MTNFTVGEATKTQRVLSLYRRDDREARLVVSFDVDDDDNLNDAVRRFLFENPSYGNAGFYLELEELVTTPVVIGG